MRDWHSAAMKVVRKVETLVGSLGAMMVEWLEDQWVARKVDQ